MRVKRSAFWYYMLTIAVVLLAVVICLRIFELDVFQPDGAVGELIPFIVSVISLLIAFLAFSISVKTYTSIDSVNSMTMMDGNVMENENYKTNIVLLLREFEEPVSDDSAAKRIRLFAKDEKESMKSVKRYMSRVQSLVEGDFTSGVRFADNIQKLMDYIVVLPYFTNSADKDIRTFAQERAGQLNARLKAEVESYANLSEGSTVLLQENVRLLDEILKLQTKRTDGKKMDKVRITGVRGSMMKNPVSRTLYYDYAGLYYYNMALETMSESLGSTRKDMFTVAMIGLASTPGKLSDVAMHKTLMYLDLALSEFDTTRKTTDATKLIPGDSVFVVTCIADAKTVLVVTKNKLCVAFEVSSINLLKRTATGVIGIKLSEDDTVSYADLVSETSEFVLDEKTYIVKDLSPGKRATRGKAIG